MDSIKLYLIAEIKADNLEEARIALDQFRESVLPSEHGIFLYQDPEAYDLICELCHNDFLSRTAEKVCDNCLDGIDSLRKEAKENGTD